VSALLAAFGLGFLAGSVPVAWIAVRLVARRDVSHEGSGNVGALNASRVSGSRLLGLLVLLGDALKGAAAAWLAGRSGLGAWDPVGLQAAATVGAVAGHDYNPWLSLAARRLVGGKGFAAAGGALLVLAPLLVPVWLGVCAAAWALLRWARGLRDEAPATLAATLALPVAAWLWEGPEAVVACTALALLILPRLLPEAWALLRTPDAPPPG
jgi:glycerol-3-phosphate acyltransferase PlsY